MERLSEEAIDALWLAALRWDDPDLTAVADALPTSWVERARQRRARLEALEPGDKARALRGLAAGLQRGLPGDPRLPSRALTLLCGEVDRETGRRWAATAAPPRRGFAASQGLRRWLGRLARRRNA